MKLSPSTLNLATINLVGFLPLIIILSSAGCSEAQNGGQVNCITASGGAGTCLPFLECVRRKQGTSSGYNLTRRKPAVCRWDTQGPVICCDHENNVSDKSAIQTCGLSSPVEEGSASRRKRQVPVLNEDWGFLDFENETDSAVGPFVVGGESAVLGKWPWMALIFLEEDVDMQSPFCGGSLISAQSILTAAHCFLGRGNSKYIVRLGELSLTRSDDGAHPVNIPVEKVVIHQDFRYPVLYNDIAVLRLSRKVHITNLVRPVCLPINNTYYNFTDEMAYVTGWGQLQEGGKRADDLQEVQLSIISSDQCQKKYTEAKVNYPEGITKQLLCTMEEAKDACQGDSGGPLVIQMPTENWVQIGVVSAGIGCARSYPGTYTRTSEYMDWIHKNMI